MTERPAWQARAACRGAGPQLFFSDKGGTESVEAKLVCRTCPVAQECLDYALEREDQYGVWGGLTLKQRRRVRRERKESAA